MLRNAIGVGCGIRINANERYGGVRSNVISVTRRREVSFFQKMSYLTSAVVELVGLYECEESIHVRLIYYVYYYYCNDH